jgi:RNA recognition motif-containing protein
MDTRLFVGNLAYSTTEDDLRGLFTQAGAVTSVAVVKDRDTGRSRGFAFVEMESQAEAQKAISMFDNYSFHERTIKVSFARPREERPRGGDMGGGRRDRDGGGRRGRP